MNQPFKIPRKKCFQPRVLKPANLSIKCECRIKTFSDTQRQNIYFPWPLSWGATEKEEAMGFTQGIQPRIEDEGLPGMKVSCDPRWQHEAGLEQTAPPGAEESSIQETKWNQWIIWNIQTFEKYYQRCKTDVIEAHWKKIHAKYVIIFHKKGKYYY